VYKIWPVEEGTERRVGQVVSGGLMYRAKPRIGGCGFRQSLRATASRNGEFRSRLNGRAGVDIRKGLGKIESFRGLSSGRNIYLILSCRRKDLLSVTAALFNWEKINQKNC